MKNPISVFTRLIKGFVRYQINAFKPSNLFHYHNFAATLLIFVFFFAIGKLADQFTLLDPLGDAFADVELTDIMFSRMGKNEQFRSETNEDGENIKIINKDIVLVNVGPVDRRGIAHMVNVVNQYEPKVIGLDIFFRKDKEPEQDFPLIAALSDVDNLVMVSEGEGFDPEELSCESLSMSNPKFTQFAHTGCATMNVISDRTVIRRFTPYFSIKDSLREEPFFAVKICELYDSTSTIELKERGLKEERISFVGNIAMYGYEAIYGEQTNFVPLEKCEHFLTLDFPDVLSGNIDPEAIKGKIVLFGFMGNPIYTGEGEDKFYTPLNEKYIGKADRDMFGVVVHANVMATILDKNYINEMPKWAMHVSGVFIVFLTLAVFRPLYNDHKIWYDGVSKLMGFSATFAILFIIGIIFEYTNYEIKFGSIYFACILLAGDWLEIYYGVISNILNLLLGKELSDED